MTPVVSAAGLRQAALGVLGVVLVVGAWQLVAAAEVFGTSISTPGAVLEQLQDPIRRSLLLTAAQVTATEALTGFGIAAVAGLVVGGLVVLLPPLRRGVDQLATIVSAIPFVALAPILLATVDRTSVAAAMSACTAFFPVYIGVVSGLSALPAPVGDVFTVYGSSSSRRLVLARVPAGLPVMANGLKVAMPLAIVGAVIGEWFGSSTGLGPVMLVAMRNYQMPTMWAAVTVTVLVALAMYAAITVLERVTASRFA